MLSVLYRCSDCTFEPVNGNSSGSPLLCHGLFGAMLLRPRSQPGRSRHGPTKEGRLRRTCRTGDHVSRDHALSDLAICLIRTDHTKPTDPRITEILYEYIGDASHRPWIGLSQSISLTPLLLVAEYSSTLLYIIRYL